MNGRVVALGTDAHRAVELLLPWYVNGSLAPADAAQVEAHLQQCAGCLAEVAWQRRLGAAPVPEAVGRSADDGWASLREQLERQEADRQEARPAPGHWQTHRPARTATAGAWRWLRWVLAAQSAAIVALAALLLVPAWTAAPYRTLGAVPAGSSANVLVVFRPTTTEAEMRQALHAAEARLVGGPTVTDAYLLMVPPGRLANALARLRADAAVARVESLDAGPAP